MEATGQRTDGVAQDFNNLLMTVLGSLKRLCNNLLGEELENAVQEDAERGAKLDQTHAGSYQKTGSPLGANRPGIV